MHPNIATARELLRLLTHCRNRAVSANIDGTDIENIEPIGRLEQGPTEFFGDHPTKGRIRFALPWGKPNYTGGPI